MSTSDVTSLSDAISLASLIDDAKCYAMVRAQRWPDGVRCPRCASATVARNGRNDRHPDRQRYRCKGCTFRFDDLTDTVYAGRHQPLRVWILCGYFMSLNLSNNQIAQELDLWQSDVHGMMTQLRKAFLAGVPVPALEGEVEIDEVYVVAGHKGQPENVKKKSAGAAAAG